MTASTPTPTLFITDAENLGAQLDNAVEKAIEIALRSPGKGILVTRHAHDKFTVALSDAVPAGLTYERDLW